MSTHALSVVPCHYSSTGVALEHPQGGSCTCKPFRLTKRQVDMLKTADEWTGKRGADGVVVKGAALRTASKLTGLGLLEFRDYGRDITSDRIDDKEWPIYAITERGRLILTRAAPPISEGSDG